MELWAGVVMAAGKGARMRSRISKVLHKMCGRELVFYPVEALRQAGIERIVVVVSRENEREVKTSPGRHRRVRSTGPTQRHGSTLCYRRLDCSKGRQSRYWPSEGIRLSYVPPH